MVLFLRRLDHRIRRINHNRSFTRRSSRLHETAVILRGRPAKPFNRNYMEQHSRQRRGVHTHAWPRESLRGLKAHHLRELCRVWTHESRTIEMHHMVGGVGAPCLCLPREPSKIPLHDLAVREAGNQHHLVPLVGKQVVQLGFACHVHRPMRACRLHTDRPASR